MELCMLPNGVLMVKNFHRDILFRRIDAPFKVGKLILSLDFHGERASAKRKLKGRGIVNFHENEDPNVDSRIGIVAEQDGRWYTTFRAADDLDSMPTATIAQSEDGENFELCKGYPRYTTPRFKVIEEMVENALPEADTAYDWAKNLSKEEIAGRLISMAKEYLETFDWVPDEKDLVLTTELPRNST